MATELLTRVVVQGEDRSRPAMRSARKGLASVSDALKRMASQATTALSSLVLVGGGLEGLRRGAASAVRAYAAIETGLVGVAKTANLTDAQIARLDRRIAELSLTPEVGQTRTALLGIAQAAGQLGVQGVDDLTRFTATIAKLEGASSDLAGAEAATALATILALGRESGVAEGIASVDRLGSVIARMGNDFRASEGQIVSFGTTVATTLSSTYDVSAREAVALGTALRDVGLRAELGANAMGRAFAEITAAAREGGDAGRQLEQVVGQSLDAIRGRIAAGDTLGVFTDFLAGLQAAGAGAADVLAAFGLDAIESARVINTLAGNVDRLRQILDAANDEWKENTALTEEARRAAGTFARQMQLVRNEINADAAALGETLAPAVLAAANQWDVLYAVAAGAAARFGVAVTQRGAALAREVAEDRKSTIARRAEIAKRAADRKAETAQVLAAAEQRVAATRRSHAAERAAERELIRAATLGRNLEDARAEVARGAAIDATKRADATRRLATARRADAVVTSIQAKAQRLHNATLSRTRVLMRGLGRAVGLLGGPLGAVITLLSIGATLWATWGRAAERATEDAAKAVRERAREMIGATRPPGDQAAAIGATLQAQLAEARQIERDTTAALSDASKLAGRPVSGLSIEQIIERRPTISDDLRDQVDALLKARADIAELVPLIAGLRDVPAALASAIAGGAGGGSTVALDTLSSDLAGLESLRAAAEDRLVQLANDRIAQVSHAERRAVAEARTIAEAAIAAEKDDATAIKVIENELAATLTKIGEAAEEERTQVRAEQADEQTRIREAALARELQAEQAFLAERQRLVEAAATARADVEQQLQSGRDTLATPWERATAAIERWEATARQAVARHRAAREALAAGGPDGALHIAAAAAEAERAYAEVTETAAARRARAWETEAQRRLQASRRWQDGATRALQTLRAETEDYAALAERGIRSAFESAGDGIAEFVRTGKLRFGDLVDNILAGLTRIALQRALVGALGGALDAFALLSLRGAGGAGDSSPLLTYGTGPTHYSQLHTGGIAGALDRSTRSGVPAAAFAGAPRLHGGGIVGLASDEVPTILRRGERVSTPAQWAAATRPPRVTVNIENRGTAQQAGPVRRHFDGRQWVVDVVLDDVRTTGPITQGLQGRFNLPDRTG